ncbi:MAG TPA: hypothetical protein VD835_18710 [Pyrinomonadaceae bacterium]|nr:hypothetical protein [Pyrinomonadaceae bacterium]
MKTLEEKIATLTDQQALSIVDSLAGELATDETPEGKEDQVQALQEILSREGQAVDVERAAEADPAAAAASARQLLTMMAQVPEIKPSLEEWLEHPPTQEAAAVPLLLAAPVVLTGCISLLYVVGHVRFTRDSDGSTKVEYDPTQTTPLDNTMKEIVATLAGLMRSMIPGKT